MENFLDTFYATPMPSFVNIFMALVFSFVLGSVLAAVYRWTHQGSTYSRSYVQTVVLACLVATVMIIAIGNSLARGLGILGALAIIRFRTPIRDPRDIVFLFASLAVGIATGAQQYLAAVSGTLFFAATALYLSVTPATSRREFEGLLRFVLLPGSASEKQLTEIFSRFTSSVENVALRDAAQGGLLEYCYQIRLLDPSFKTDLISALNQLEDISDVSLVMQRSTVEI